MLALPVLYSFRRCPYAMRARLALAVSALPVELREVTLRSKPAELLAASPKGTVPVLVLPDGKVIDESLDVMLWVLRQNDPEGWLPVAEASLEEMLALIAECDGKFKPHLDRYKYPNRYPQEVATAPDTARSLAQRVFAEHHRAEAAVWLMALEVRLAGHSSLFGDRASLADMALLPFVRQFAHTDEAWFSAQPWPHLLQWLARFEGSDLFASVMRERLQAWVSSTQTL